MNELYTYKHYLNLYLDYNPYYMNAIQEAETKGEIKSIKDQFIKDIKREEYPKQITKQIIAHIRKL